MLKKKKHDSNVAQVCICLRGESRNVVYGFKNSIQIKLKKKNQTHFYKLYWVWHHKRLFRSSLLRISKNTVTLFIVFFLNQAAIFYILNFHTIKIIFARVKMLAPKACNTKVQADFIDFWK